MRSLLLLMSLPALMSADPQCQPHEITDSALNLCYSYQPSFANYTIALRTCRSMGYDLVSIHTAFQNSIISSFATEQFDATFDDYWIGGSNLINGSWQWSDSSDLDFVRWGPGEPVPDRHCLAVQVADAKWGAKTCSDMKAFVCAGPPGSGPAGPTSGPCATSLASKCNCGNQLHTLYNYLKKH